MNTRFFKKMISNSLLVCTLMLLGTNNIFAASDVAVMLKPQSRIITTVKSTQNDFDGDGKKDTLRVQFKTEEEKYDFAQDVTIEINDIKIDVSGDQIESKVFIIDLDCKDSIKEIAIVDHGPSDDNTTTIYRYDGKKIISLGEIEGEMGKSYFKVSGDGSINTNNRSELLQTWWFKAKYVFNSKTLKLEMQKQKVYDSARTYDVKVIKKFKAYTKNDVKSKTISLAKGTKIILNGTDEKQWVRFVDSKGKTGWIRMEIDKFDIIAGYGSATDYLDGLEMFD